MDKSDAAAMVSALTFDNSTGIFTVVYGNGARDTIDTNLEKVAVNYEFDKTTQTLYLIMEDGTKEPVDLSSLIGENEFLDTDTIAFAVEKGNVSATVKEASIQEKHLRPNYLADIKVESASAAKSAADALQSETNAKASEDAAKSSEGNAKSSEDNAKSSADSARLSEANAKASEDAAKSSADSAKSSADDASKSASELEGALDGIKDDVDAAHEAAEKAKSYAVGDTGTRDGEGSDNSKYYSEQAKNYAEEVQVVASLVVPKFYIDFDTGCLMSETEAKGMEFEIQDGNFIGRTV
jgi:hypothetical protein